jgi:hypothetical protein
MRRARKRAAAAEVVGLAGRPRMQRAYERRVLRPARTGSTGHTQAAARGSHGDDSVRDAGGPGAAKSAASVRALFDGIVRGDLLCATTHVSVRPSPTIYLIFLPLYTMQVPPFKRFLPSSNKISNHSPHSLPSYQLPPYFNISFQQNSYTFVSVFVLMRIPYKYM